MNASSSNRPMQVSAFRRSNFLRVDAGTAIGRNTTAGNASARVPKACMCSAADDEADCALLPLLVPIWTEAVALPFFGTARLAEGLTEQTVLGTVVPIDDNTLHCRFVRVMSCAVGLLICRV